MGGNFKFRGQDSFFGIFFFSRFGDLKKQIALSEKKPPLTYLVEICDWESVKSVSIIAVQRTYEFLLSYFQVL